MTAVKVAPEERLFSLVLALLATEHGLTKQEILSSVRGYADEWAGSNDHTALERKFERDKNGLRELGIPVETMEDAGDPGNNQNLRYRIPRAGYDLPADLTFTPKEVALLNLAALAWQEGSLSADSRRALLKLASLGVDAEEPTIGYAPRIRTRDRAFQPLAAAITERQAVRFPYLMPSRAEALVRSVEPLALVQHHGRWHLYAWDLDRDAPRTFLLSRITGAPVRTAQRAADRGSGHHATALAGLDELWERQRASIEVEPGSDAAVRLSRRGEIDDEGRVVLHYTDEVVLAAELAGFGPEVYVVAPESLQRAVVGQLEAVAAAHRSRES